MADGVRGQSPGAANEPATSTGDGQPEQQAREEEQPETRTTVMGTELPVTYGSQPVLWMSRPKISSQGISPPVQALLTGYGLGPPGERAVMGMRPPAPKCAMCGGRNSLKAKLQKPEPATAKVCGWA